MNVLTALRAVEGGRRGSSRPIVVETEAGACLVKLRGAAQGTGPLVAEIIVAEIAESLGLSVPKRYLVELGADIDVPERDAELRDSDGRERRREPRLRVSRGCARSRSRPRSTT